MAAVFCICFTFLYSFSHAEEYTKDDMFFQYGFWREATADDVKKHIKQGYDINTINTWEYGIEAERFSQVNILAFALAWYAKPEAIEELVKHGAAITADAMYNASDIDVLKKLVQLGGNVNALNKDNKTALHKVLFISVPMVEFLLQQGALPNIKSSSGDTALSILIDDSGNYDKQWKDKVTLLENAGAKLGQGQRPKHLGLPKYAVQKNTQTTYNYKHNFYNADFWRVATLEDVKENIIAGEDLHNERAEHDGATILGLASKHTADPTIIEFLIGKGAKVDYTTIFGAASNENSKILQTLLMHVVDDADEPIHYGTAAMIAAEAALKDNLALLIVKDPEISKVNFADSDYFTVIPTKGRPDRKETITLLKGTPY